MISFECCGVMVVFAFGVGIGTGLGMDWVDGCLLLRFWDRDLRFGEKGVGEDCK